MNVATQLAVLPVSCDYHLLLCIYLLLGCNSGWPDPQRD